MPALKTKFFSGVTLIAALFALSVLAGCGGSGQSDKGGSIASSRNVVWGGNGNPAPPKAEATPEPDATPTAEATPTPEPGATPESDGSSVTRNVVWGGVHDDNPPPKISDTSEPEATPTPEPTPTPNPAP